jgi:hypothetical protein
LLTGSSCFLCLLKSSERAASCSAAVQSYILVRRWQLTCGGGEGLGELVQEQGCGMQQMEATSDPCYNLNAFRVYLERCLKGCRRKVLAAHDATHILPGLLECVFAGLYEGLLLDTVTQLNLPSYLSVGYI